MLWESYAQARQKHGYGGHWQRLGKAVTRHIRRWHVIENTTSARATRSRTIYPAIYMCFAGPVPFGLATIARQALLYSPISIAVNGSPWSARSLRSHRASFVEAAAVAVGGSAVGRGVAPQLCTAHPQGPP